MGAKCTTMTPCKNCGQPATDAYCSHCGQKTATGRITFGDIWHGIAHFFTHLEHGFLHTTRELIVRPGAMVTDYLAGRRKRHQPPVSYFLIWITAFLLFLVGLDKMFGPDIVISYHDYFGPGPATAFAISNLALVLTAIIPVQAVYLWLLLARPAYNYAETLVIGLYSIGTIIVFQVVFALLALLVHAVSGSSLPLQLSDIFKVGYMSWFAWDLARQLNIRFRIARWLLFLVLAFGTFTAWRMFGVPFMAGMLGHPA